MEYLRIGADYTLTVNGKFRLFHPEDGLAAGAGEIIAPMQIPYDISAGTILRLLTMNHLDTAIFEIISMPPSADGNVTLDLTQMRLPLSERQWKILSEERFEE